MTKSSKSIIKNWAPLQLYVFVAVFALIIELIGGIVAEGHHEEKFSSVLKSLFGSVIFYGFFYVILEILCKPSSGKFANDLAWVLILSPFIMKIFVLLTSSLTTIIHGDNCECKN